MTYSLINVFTATRHFPYEQAVGDRGEKMKKPQWTLTGWVEREREGGVERGYKFNALRSTKQEHFKHVSSGLLKYFILPVWNNHSN